MKELIYVRGIKIDYKNFIFLRMDMRKSAFRKYSPESHRNRNSVNNNETYRINNQPLRNSSLTPHSTNSIKRFKNHHQQPAKDTSLALAPKTQRFNPRHTLKTTLSDLQSKINKAKNILKTNKKLPSLGNFLQIEEDLELEELQSTIVKKNQDTGFDLTQNSTKLFSFCRNEAKIHKPTMNSPRSFKTNKLYYIREIEKLYFGFQNQQVQQHLFFSLKIFRSLAKIQAPQFSSMEQHRINVPQLPDNKHKKTLLLDLDETILHCDQIPIHNHEYDFILDIKIQQNETVKAYINLRPYALTFLKNMAKLFQIIAFTASHQSYADEVLNQIDPDQQIFAFRLYRESCQEIAENLFTKDLRMINRNLQRMVLVDNSPYSYIFQLQNGVPILPYYRGTDRQLPELQKYLERVSECSDVRELNKETFRFHRYTECDTVDELMRVYFQK